MNDEKLICEMCGREVNDGEYITSSEGDIICKCCAFDELAEEVAVLASLSNMEPGELIEIAQAITRFVDNIQPRIREIAVAKDSEAAELLSELISRISDADDTETDA